MEQGSGATTWTFGYDAARELTSAKRYSGSTLLEAPYYGYDKAGNRVQVGTGAAAPKNYDVNALNQLLSERDHGRTTFSGFVDEPATVKVNGKAAKVTSTDGGTPYGGTPYRFEGIVDLDAGANTVVVEMVQAMLGSASLDSTALHAHVAIRMLKEVHERTHPGAGLGKPDVTKSKNGAVEVEAADLLAALKAEKGEEVERSGAVSAFDEESITE